jgi:hypothetical protein
MIFNVFLHLIPCFYLKGWVRVKKYFLLFTQPFAFYAGIVTEDAITASHLSTL